MEDTVFTRRAVLRLAASTGVAATAAGALAACGISDKPSSSSDSAAKSGRKVRLGFMPASDAAALFMAKELGHFKERDLDVDIIRQASFAAMRDNLQTGKLDAAHALYSIPLAVATRIAGNGSTDIKIAMLLSNNGQSLTLHKDFAAAGYGDLAAAKAVLDRAPVTLAMTFPGGTHDVFLRYWLKATKADASKVKIVTTPPPQMVANMKVNNMAGFFAGEPWAYKGVHEADGFTNLLSQDLWADHPEKALIVGPSMKARQDVLADVMGAILKASQWLDDKPENRAKAAQVAAGPAYVNMAASDLADRLQGHYNLGAGLGVRTETEHPMVFYRGGAVAPLRRSHALWYLAQFQRVGLIATAPDFQKIVDDILLRDVFAKVADKEKLTIPDDDMAPISIKLDGATFDPTKPQDEVGRP
jgi:nitrate/nitrite transport system substrate-binding protein